jgi:hypothetical protein
MPANVGTGQIRLENSRLLTLQTPRVCDEGIVKTVRC